MTFRIALINQSSLKSIEIRPVVKAINLQLREDFKPVWCIAATIKQVRASTDISKVDFDGFMYLRDSPPESADYAGYHDTLSDGRAVGYSFTDISEALKEDWSVTLSHEVLEMVGNRNVNYFALGPHPKKPSKTVFHWLEMCDAVQGFQYKKGPDGVLVSDFVCPAFFTPEEDSSLTHFQNKKFKLKSLSAAPDGYLGFYDPETGEDSSIFGNRNAEKRFEIKSRAGLLRRKSRISKLLERAG